MVSLEWARSKFGATLGILAQKCCNTSFGGRFLKESHGFHGKIKTLTHIIDSERVAYIAKLIVNIDF